MENGLLSSIEEGYKEYLKNKSEGKGHKVYWHRNVLVEEAYCVALDRTVFFLVMLVTDKDSKFYDAEVPYHYMLLRTWRFGSIDDLPKDLPKDLLEEVDMICDAWYGEGQSAPEGVLYEKLYGEA